MPIYEYQCECGFRGEKFWKTISKAKDTIPCEACGKAMDKIPSVAGHAFKHPESQTRGALPPSTGTSDDHNFDLAIGRDAEKKWDAIGKRDEIKDATVREERAAGRGVTRDHLVPKADGSGEYRVITEPERQRVNAHRETAFKIAQAAKESGESPAKK